MKSIKTKRVLLTMVFLIAFAGLALAFGPQVDRSLELNGISSVPGFKRAFFVLARPDAWVSPHSFMLSEGESQYGVKLLAVDAASNSVEIETDGLKQTLRIRSAPVLSTVAAVSGGEARLSARGEDGLAGSADPNNPADDRRAGNPGYGSLPANSSRATSGQNAKSAQTTIPGLNPNEVDPATTFSDQSQTEWYKESAVIEQNRLETEPAVLAGEMTPWPRTPLTPPGTPDNLVGPEAFFSNHIPGYRQPASF